MEGHIPINYPKIDKIPDFSNSFSREILERIGEFVYDCDPDHIN